VKQLFEEYREDVVARNKPGSNRASSYLKALEYLGPILTASTGEYSDISDVFGISDAAIIKELYQYVLTQQSVGDGGIFSSKHKPSYWRNGFYSAALKDYGQFLIRQSHAQKCWQIYDTPSLSPGEIGRKLLRIKISAAELLFEGDDVKTMPIGKDVIREAKARVNHSFFRRMILRDYSQTCCVSGLSVPEVLRASHVIPWAEDQQNRMNPANGLCLAATYDAAFDRHLISFDEDYRLILAPSLKEYFSSDAFKKHFLAYEGKPIQMPHKFAPDVGFLEKHRAKMSNN